MFTPPSNTVAERVMELKFLVNSLTSSLPPAEPEDLIQSPYRPTKEFELTPVPRWYKQARGKPEPLARRWYRRDEDYTVHVPHSRERFLREINSADEETLRTRGGFKRTKFTSDLIIYIRALIYIDYESAVKVGLAINHCLREAVGVNIHCQLYVTNYGTDLAQGYQGEKEHYEMTLNRAAIFPVQWPYLSNENIKQLDPEELHIMISKFLFGNNRYPCSHYSKIVEVAKVLDILAADKDYMIRCLTDAFDRAPWKIDRSLTHQTYL
jgi:hypothetical protein